MSQDHWDQRAGRYDQLAWVNSAAHMGPVERILTGLSPTFALDLGCGSGALTEKLAAVCPRGVALDISAEMLGQARKRVTAPGWHFARVNAEGVSGYNDEQIDLIATRMFLHHTAYPLDAIRCWHDALVEDGHLLIIEGAPPTDDWKHPANALFRLAFDLKEPGRQFMTPGDIAGFMREAGFREVTTVEWWTDDNSMENWLSGDSSADLGVIDRVRNIHWSGYQIEAVREVYDMRKVRTPDDDAGFGGWDDLTMRWRHCAVLGRK